MANISVDKLKKFFKDPDYRFLLLSSYGFYNWMSDEEFLKKTFKIRVGYDLNLENPQSYNEKLQWLKIHDRKPIYTTMVDKYEVKQYIANKIGEQYVIPTYGVWDDFDAVNFDSLPDQFVMKCTHDSGGITICRDKTTFNRKKAKESLKKHLKKNYYWVGREWPYKNVKPKIMAEKFIADKTDYDLKDYKFFCFNGKVKILYVTSNRGYEGGLRIDFFDLEWNHMDIIHHKYPQNEKRTPSKPKNFDEMIRLAERLSTGIPHVRVDMYDIDGKIYIGEFTFYQDAGFEPLSPNKWNYIFGDWLKLPEKGYKRKD